MCRAIRVTVSLYILFLAATPSAHGQSRFVYKIIVTNGKVESRQTGFRLNGIKGIVTALHGVADSINGKEIYAESNTRQVLTKPLRISFVDVRRDLAIVTSDELERNGSEGLEVGALPAANSRVTVTGHPNGIELSTDKFVVTDNSTVLQNLIPQKMIAAFALRGSPDANISVLKMAEVEGGTGPGNSGSPVLYGSKVVAVLNGGLDEGRRGIAWAMPIQRIEWKTPSSNILRKLARADSTSLFSTVEFDLTDAGKLRINRFVQAMKRIVNNSTRGFVDLTAERYADTRFVSKVAIPEADVTIVSPNRDVSAKIDAKTFEELDDTYNMIVLAINQAFPNWRKRYDEVDFDGVPSRQRNYESYRTFSVEDPGATQYIRLTSMKDSYGRFYVSLSFFLWKTDR